MIKLDTSHSGQTLIVRTDTDSLVVDAADLDSLIIALCAERQRRDPVKYMDFVGNLIPYTAIIEQGLTVHGVVERFGEAVTTDGRTKVTVVETFEDAPGYVDVKIKLD